jgi:hypothetical protein
MELLQVNYINGIKFWVRMGRTAALSYGEIMLIVSTLYLRRPI